MVLTGTRRETWDATHGVYPLVYCQLVKLARCLSSATRIKQSWIILVCKLRSTRSLGNEISRDSKDLWSGCGDEWRHFFKYECEDGAHEKEKGRVREEAFFFSLVFVCMWYASTLRRYTDHRIALWGYYRPRGFRHRRYFLGVFFYVISFSKGKVLVENSKEKILLLFFIS